jgi:hypothetical protein
MLVEGRSLVQANVKSGEGGEIGQPCNSTRKLQTALHAKAKAELSEGGQSPECSTLHHPTAFRFPSCVYFRSGHAKKSTAQAQLPHNGSALGLAIATTGGTALIPTNAGQG